MRTSFIFRACVLSLTLLTGLGVSSTASAWAAYHNGNYYRGGGYHGYHGAYYGGYRGGYGYGYRGYPYGGWAVPGVVGVPVYYGYRCHSVRTCYANGRCVSQRICR